MLDKRGLAERYLRSHQDRLKFSAIKLLHRVHAGVEIDLQPARARDQLAELLHRRRLAVLGRLARVAEGRLLLCDALSYAADKKPSCILDLATLTGACVVALGDAAAGLFTENAKLRKQIETAPDTAGDPVGTVAASDPDG